MHKIGRLLIVLLIFGTIFTPAVRAGHDLPGPSQTIPTRTPTPGPPPPTSPPPTVAPPGGGDGTQPPPATDTTTPTPTGPTPTPSSTFVPADSLTPTAAPCNDRPTLQARNVTNVRLGPGTGYDVVEELFYLEVRLITGRAANAEWWQIGTMDGGNGWVADAVVDVQGYIGNVPVVAAPLLSGRSPTPGIPWNPTPRASCTVTPTPPATATNTPTSSPTTGAAIDEATATSSLASGDASPAVAVDTATPTLVPPTTQPTLEPEPLFPDAKQAGETMPTLVAVATPVSGEVGAASVAGATGEQGDAGAELLVEEMPPVSTNLFLLSGVAFLGASLLATFFRRRGR